MTQFLEMKMGFWFLRCQVAGDWGYRKTWMGDVYVRLWILEVGESRLRKAKVLVGIWFEIRGIYNFRFSYSGTDPVGL